MRIGMRACAVAAMLAGLAACGSLAPPPPTQGAAVPMSPAPVAAPRFGDARPVLWRGPGPAAHPVHGIDISRYQTAIHWPTARDAGVSFAFIKATEGADRLDPAFARHWAEARAAGIPRGAYHFYYFCRSAEDQARWFITHVPKERGALAPVVDLEWNPHSPTCTWRPDPAHVRAEVLRFLDLLEAHYGQRPLIYTEPGFWQDNGLEQLRGEELWLRSVAAHPEEVYGRRGWTFWQYSGTGLVPGVQGQVDLNAFGGTIAQWRRWLAARSLR
ncbi:Lyzozyme M1 (1,4-beta-N-acetylmuramidase) [Rubellimicrobium thermophilum DSM 16684]|uniref:Lyzozyme M1 (1,4-beta-N-acetylmuramidase) n=1 Tax=Rubellimicrobium thermophilum DSM 16684 TaxID=1123069 RepID=S9S3A5_9RHOB|nr:GH25 family lysozyme [Rubellimicrobium thermophilum]EPX84670.1 Lyzozyme M1 (1,4-beta-N-acetylmuramidase) [Rubellimicrobium thermophilum DSM 16684]